MNKFIFESTYPIDLDLYITTRFRLDGQKPYQIEFDNFVEKTTWTCEEGIQRLNKYLKNKNLNHLYSFKVTMDNTLIESFYISGQKTDLKIKLHTNIRDIREFFNYIFPLNGVLLYGTIDSKEHFTTRDDVCCKFAHELYPIHTDDFSASWFCDEPYINHFFVFPKVEKKESKIEHCVALGGGPLDKSYIKENTSANFYLMKSLDRNKNNAYIKATDDMNCIESFEKEIVVATINALQKERIEHEIQYKVTW